MAVRIGLDSFLAVVKRSNLVPPDRLDSLLHEFQAPRTGPGDAQGFADYLVERNVLTAWQAGKLLQGKHKGFLLGKYRLLSLIGKGGMSSVYLAEHVVMRRRCAIKVLPTRRVRDASYLARFHREAQAVAALDHPNIVRAYDVDQEVDGEMEVHFLVMEFVDGKSLLTLVQEHPDGRLPPAVAVEYIRQAALGLAHAHQAGLVHRDVKPGNVLVDGQGTVKLLDLGLARFFHGEEQTSLTVQHDERVLGTADYLAPEQALDSHRVDGRADIYSLGCTLYFCLTGHPPFTEGTLAQRLLAHQTREPPPIESLQPEVSASLAAILRKMMAKDPASRYQNASEVAAALKSWIEADRQAAPSRQPGSTSPPRRAVRQDRQETPLLGGDTLWQQPPVVAPSPARKGEKATSIGGSGASAERTPSGGQRAGTPASASVTTDDQGSGSHSKGDRNAGDSAAAIESGIDESSSGGWDEPDLHRPIGGNGGQSRREHQSWIFDIPAEESLLNSRIRKRSTTGSSKIRGRRDRRERRERRKQEASVWGVVGGIVVVLAVLVIWLTGRSDSRPKRATVEKAPREPEQAPPAAKRPELGPELSVRPGGDFETIGAALAYISEHRARFSGNPSWTVKVAGGHVLEESIVIEGSAFGGFPPGVAIVSDGDAPAVLRPKGSAPVVELEGVERLVLRGFVLDGSGRDLVVRLSGFLVGTQLQDLELRKIARRGVAWEDVSGLANAPLTFLRMRCYGDSPAAVCVEMGDARQIRFEECRFVGPMRAGLEFTSSPWNADVSVRRCIFHNLRTGIHFTGQSPDLQRIEIVNNTFHRLECGLEWDDMPQAGSAGLAVHHNLFWDLTGPEVRIHRGFDPETAAALLPDASAQNNWSQRAESADADGAEGLELFGGGQRGVENLSFASTDPDSPSFLKPIVSRPQNSVKSPAAGADPFVGAVAP